MAIERTMTLQIAELAGGGFVLAVVGKDEAGEEFIDPVHAAGDLHACVGYCADMIHQSFQITEEQKVSTDLPRMMKERSGNVIVPRTGFFRRIIGGGG